MVRRRARAGGARKQSSRDRVLMLDAPLADQVDRLPKTRIRISHQPLVKLHMKENSLTAEGAESALFQL